MIKKTRSKKSRDTVPLSNEYTKYLFKKKYDSLKCTVSSEMDPAEIRFIGYVVFNKDRGTEIFRKIRPFPIL